MHDSGNMVLPVVAEIPSDLPLQYYFSKYGIQWDEFALPPGEIRRANVIVNRDWAQTVESVLRARGIATAFPEPARSLILELRGAAVYQVLVDQ
jgi:hypothetical protein